jgi:hypothetical protein
LLTGEGTTVTPDDPSIFLLIGFLLRLSKPLP